MPDEEPVKVLLRETVAKLAAKLEVIRLCGRYLGEADGSTTYAPERRGAACGRTETSSSF